MKQVTFWPVYVALNKSYSLLPAHPACLLGTISVEQVKRGCTVDQVFELSLMRVIPLATGTVLRTAHILYRQRGSNATRSPPLKTSIEFSAPYVQRYATTFPCSARCCDILIVRARGKITFDGHRILSNFLWLLLMVFVVFP